MLHVITRLGGSIGPAVRGVSAQRSLTHSWMPLKKDPKSPIMPRNSTRLRFFTMNSSQTLEIP
ncbi:hypothetical protein EYF80_061044 [Liparis tanakae]|uniref:Uncharacterized protein n=1 Tax=Liparis tanakae TaxID=230148 RepID=A0A4Z2EJ29_9TELE|nr:hypothetical protein EYF80_061044 [Liparis tanakae]